MPSAVKSSTLLLMSLLSTLLLSVDAEAGDRAWYEDVLQLDNESRSTILPQRKYCDGISTVPPSSLFAVPVCTIASTQQPLLNQSAKPYELYRLQNLSFCCKSNYTTALPVGTNVTAKDEEARFLYRLAVDRALWRYDCASFYPFHSCAPCAYAYRSWVCALMFPLACTVSGTSDRTLSTVQWMPICRSVCLEVQRKCPSTFQFKCPATTQYAYPQPPSGFSNTSDIGSRGCNPMEHPLG